jgi:hypothetical protein
MWFLLLALPAQAADLRIAHTEALGTDVLDVVVDSSGDVVAALEAGTGQVRLLDLDSWEVGSRSVCSGTGTAIAATPADSEEGNRIYVGCSDGTVGWLSRSGGSWSAESGVVDLGSGEVLGIVTVAGNVWAVAEQADAEGNPQVFGFAEVSEPDLADPAEQGILGVAGFNDFEPASAVAFVAHGGDRMSRVDGSTGSITVPTTTIGVADTQDIIVTPGNAVLAAAGTGGVVGYSTGGSDMSLLLDDEDGLQDVTGLFWMDERLWVADAGRGEVVAFDMASTSSVPGDDVLQLVAWPGDAGTAAVSEVAVAGGYAVMGTTTGELWVMTDRPWVEIGAVAPDTALQGDTATVTFASDVGGSWTLYRDATTDTDGVALASGTATAGASTTASFNVGGGFAEGDNELRLVLEDGDGDLGHDVGTLNVDNPPGAVNLRKAGVQFGNEKLFVSFTALTDEDVTDYAVFVTTTPFERSDWSTCDDGTSPCGPAFDGDDNLSTPVSVTADPGEDVELTLSPLTNGQIYYIAVRATDAGGQEGAMSKVRSGMPQETFGIAGLSGDEGGYCGLPGAASAGLALFGLGALITRRRRRVGPLAALVATGIGLSVAAPAHAQDAVSDEPGLIDREAYNATVTFRYGPVNFSDEAVTEVLTSSGNQIMWLEIGPRILPNKIRILDFTVGIGRLREPGKLVNIEGTSSGEESKLRAIPVAGDLTFRAQYKDEQWVVPYGSAGLEYWLWSEDTNVNGDASDDSIVAGGKAGYHWAVGGNVLLDHFDRKRASLLRARTGIDDTWLTFEYRNQTVGNSDGFDFNGTVIGVGLKVDY